MTDHANPSASAEWRSNWGLVLATTAAMSMSAVATASLGVMMEPIENDLGWSRTEISFGTSLVTLIGMVLATGAGLAIDRIGPRPIGLLVAVLFCGGIAMMSTIGTSLWQWWGLWALVGVAAAAIPTVWMAPVSRQFSAGRGLAMAVTLSGTGISSTAVPIIANALVQDYGWRIAYLGLGAIWAAIVLPLLLIFFRSSPERGSAPAGGLARTTSADLPGLTAREGFRSPKLYKLAAAAFFSMSAGTALILNLVPVLRSTGITPGTAATVAGAIGIATIVGRLIGGWLMDRMSAAVIAAVSTAGASVLPFTLLLLPGNVTAATAAVALYGLFGGSKVPALVYLASRHFGARAFGVLYAAVGTMISFGVSMGPLAANYVFDLTRSYEPTMWTAVPFLGIGALLYLSLGPYPDFSAKAEPAQSTAA